MTDDKVRVPEHPLGVKVMDEDHAALEALFDEIAQWPDERLSEAFERAKAEVAAHFMREEEVMRAHEVPVFFCHKAQHQRILDLLEAAGGLLGDPDRARLRIFLSVILPNEVQAHVNSVDRMTASFLTGKMTSEASDGLRLPERDVLNLG